MSTAYRVSSPDTTLTRHYARQTAQALTAMVHKRPRVHCITSTVSLEFTADILMAVGAHPSMTMGQDEIADFVACAQSLNINIGTLDNQRRTVIIQAIETALDYQKPWILDPVSVHASEHRRDYALELIAMRPTVICGNSAEIHSLACSDSPYAAQILAERSGAIVAQTGENDLVTDGKRTVMVANGDPMQTRVSAMGCATNALIAGFLALDHDAFDATVEALLTLGVAAEQAVRRAEGPGTLHMYLLDELYGLNQNVLSQQGHIVPVEMLSAAS
ncbi:MAG: hydroxyethylthiazole kinase [Marinobacterium sp.]|nr:hydroxyethylthiazole kinase [Marinobacterium sp.]